MTYAMPSGEWLVSTTPMMLIALRFLAGLGLGQLLDRGLAVELLGEDAA